MDFDNLKGTKEVSSFNKNFDSQLKQFNKKNKNATKTSQFRIDTQKKGFKEDSFDLFEPT